VETKGEKILELVDVHTYYGDTQVLFGVSLEVATGSVVALLGRNGMGKTTLIRSVIGVTPARRGAMRFKGQDIAGLVPYRIARMGVGLVPQGRQIFPSLSVKENLTMTARDGRRPGAWTLERIYELFPILKQRSSLPGNLLSGGEQQMLSMGRALMTNPELLLMDEPSEGLAPLIVSEIGRIIQEIHSRGLSVLLVEQNLKMALRLAQRVYVMSRGLVVHQSTPQELQDNKEIMDRHLGVAG
jgi:branched-chain amino acid transport system ATP-binding protein